jgi:hypothetical protein
MSGAIPPLQQYVFMAWCLIKDRETFTLTIYNYTVTPLVYLKDHYSWFKEPGQLSGIALSYVLDDRVSNPGKGWEFFSSPPRPDRPCGPPSILSNG